jgi:hypothetical protein
MLDGPELIAPGGRRYRAGDRVVTLAPGANGALVTSERAIVEAVDVDRPRMVLLTEEQRRVALGADEISAERLAHGYAVTAHRSQGQTTERAHLFVDGGGRELAYEAMSRAKESSHAYLVADNLDQAAEDLVREWSADRRMRWAIDIGAPEDPSTVDLEAGRLDLNRARQAAMARVRLSAILEARHAAVPADPTLDVVEITKQLRQVRQLRSDLAEGRGVWADTEAGRAGRDLTEARRRAAGSSRMAESAGGWRERRSHRKDAATWTQRETEALVRWSLHSEPEAARLDGLIAKGESAAEQVRRRRDHRSETLDEFHRHRTSSAWTLSELDQDIDALRDHLDGIEQPITRETTEQSLRRPRGGLERGHDYDIAPDRDVGLGR